MRDINTSWIKNNGLILLTTRHLSMGSKLYAADFKDEEALIFIPTGNFIGLNRTGVMRLGRRPYMRDGIWLLHLDEEIESTYADIQLTPDNASLKRI